MIRWLALALLLSAACAPRAEAQDESEPATPSPTVEAEVDAEVDALARAREFFAQGVELTRQDRWGEALVFFRRSLALVERPNTLFNVAGILVRLGRGREAVEHYERYLRVAPADDPDRAAALAALASARAALARIQLRVEPETAELRVDGLRSDATGPIRELELDPGEHVIDLSLPGYHREVLRVSLLPGIEGERRVELVRITEGEQTILPPEQDEPPPVIAPPRPTRQVLRIDETPAHVLLVAGLATMAIGGAGIAWGLADRADVEGAIGAPRWSDYADAYERTQVVTPLGVAVLVLGAGVAVAGLAWLGALHVSVSIGPAEARLDVQGRF